MREVATVGGLSVVEVAPGPQPPICVVDFARFVDTTTLAMLLAGNNRGHAVYRIDPLRDLHRARPESLVALAAGYAEVLFAARIEPMAVASYCSMANLGVRLAGEFGVPAIPVEPAWPDEQLVRREELAVHPALQEADRFLSWLRFLRLTAAAPEPEPAPGLHLITSFDRDYGPAPGWSGPVPRTVLRIPHNSLLEAPNVANLVHAIVDK